MKHASQQEDPPTGGNQILSGKLVLVRRTKKLINKLKFWFSFFWTKRKNGKTAGFWFLLTSIIPRKQSNKTYLALRGARYVLLLCFLGIIDTSRNQKPAVFSFFRFVQKNENLNFSSFIRFLVLTERNEFTTQYLVSAGGRVLLLASVLHWPVLFIIKVLPFDNVDKNITVL